MGKSRITNIKHLKGYLAGTSAKNKEVVNDIIQAYEDNKIPNYKTAQS